MEMLESILLQMSNVKKAQRNFIIALLMNLKKLALLSFEWVKKFVQKQ